MRPKAHLVAKSGYDYAHPARWEGRDEWGTARARHLATGADYHRASRMGRSRRLSPASPSAAAPICTRRARSAAGYAALSQAQVLARWRARRMRSGLPGLAAL